MAPCHNICTDYRASDGRRELNALSRLDHKALSAADRQRIAAAAIAAQKEAARIKADLAVAKRNAAEAETVRIAAAAANDATAAEDKVPGYQSMEQQKTLKRQLSNEREVRVHVPTSAGAQCAQPPQVATLTRRLSRTSSLSRRPSGPEQIVTGAWTLSAGLQHACLLCR